MENKNDIFKKIQKEKTDWKAKFKHEKKVAQANKFEHHEDKKWYNYLQLPKRWVDVTDPFYFKVYKLKTDGVIFLLTSLLIPFLITMIAYLAIPVNLDLRQWVSQTGYFVSAIIGFALLMVRDRNLAFKTGTAYYFLPVFTSFGIGLIQGLLVDPIDDILIKSYINMALNIVLLLIWITVFLTYLPDLKSRITKTLHDNWKMVIIVGLIAGTITWAISGPLVGLMLNNTGLDANSSNQAAFSTNRIINAILIFIYTVCLAPLYEEIIYRNFYYLGVGNKVVGFFASALMFGLVHVVGAGDLDHILPYFVGGLCLSGVFLIARGNFTYSWITHLVYNLITIILMYSLNWVW